MTRNSIKYYYNKKKRNKQYEIPIKMNLFTIPNRRKITGNSIKYTYYNDQKTNKLKRNTHYNELFSILPPPQQNLHFNNV